MFEPVLLHLPTQLVFQLENALHVGLKLADSLGRAKLAKLPQGNNNMDFRLACYQVVLLETAANL